MATLGRRLAAAATVMSAALALAAPASARPVSAVVTGWPQLQGDAGHTGDEVGEKSVTRQNVNQLTMSWTQALPANAVYSEVAVSAETAYVIAADQVLAFDAVTGAPLWTATMPSDLLGTPSVQGGLVLVGYNDPKDKLKGYVAALNAGTGAVTWTKEVGRLSPDSLSQGTTVTTTANRAYVSLLSGQVDALALTGGGLLWTSLVLPGGSATSLGCVLSPPSVSGTSVVVGGGGEAVTALSAATGAVAWSDTQPFGRLGAVAGAYRAGADDGGDVRQPDLGDDQPVIVVPGHGVQLRDRAPGLRQPGVLRLHPVLPARSQRGPGLHRHRQRTGVPCAGSRFQDCA